MWFRKLGAAVALPNAAWLFRFAVAVMPLVWLAGLRYLPWISVEGALTTFYLVLLYVGHLSLFPLLVLLPMLLFVHLPAILFRVLSAGLITLMIALLLLDTLVYDLYRFHINSFVLEMVLLSGTDTFGLSAATYLLGASALAVIIAAVVLMARWRWRWCWFVWRELMASMPGLTLPMTPVSPALPDISRCTSAPPRSVFLSPMVWSTQKRRVASMPPCGQQAPVCVIRLSR
jgi:hypothetical protein